MTTRKPGGRPSQPTRSTGEAASAQNAPRPFARLAAMLLLSPLQWFMTLLAVLVIGFSGVWLAVAWQAGPRVFLQHHEYARYTASAPALVPDSWLAVDLDPSTIRSASQWRSIARAIPCAVLNVQGDWSATRERAFCGTATDFKEAYDVAGLQTLAPRVPFSWPRDIRGFAIPQLRVSAALHDWLFAHPANRFMHSRWPARSELDWLTLELDTPVDAAVAGWITPTRAQTVLYDPQRPGDFLPAGVIETRRAERAGMVVPLVMGTIGLVIWWFGMSLLPAMGNFNATGRVVLTILPLLALPWWAGEFPRALRALNPTAGGLIADIFQDLDRTDRLVASRPSDALLADGRRIAWRLEDSHYADTFGHLRFVPPAEPPPSDDAAFNALVQAVTTEVTTFDAARRAAFFDALRRDKQLGLTAAGTVALPAARTGALDEDPRVRRAARAFLDEWNTSPRAEADPHHLAFRARRALLEATPQTLR